MHAEGKRPIPAGQGTVAQLYRRRHNWRHRLGEERSFVPCWIASFVIHLVVLILLATLILPQVDDPFLRPLLLSLSTNIAAVRQAPAEPVLITQDENLARGKQGPDEMADRDVTPEPPADLPVVNLPAEVPEVATDVEPQPQATASLPEVQPAPADFDDPFAAPLGRLPVPARLVSSTSARASSVVAPLSALDAGRQQAELDHIVDRFIEYDIGRLRGAEGAAALRNFEALGPEAIPALVRGLNRSASIHASCPVCVITSKLQSTLSQSKDRTMFAYAVANIGRDVPENAPHFGRLVNLLDHLTDSPEGLIAGLEDADPEVRQQALMQLVGRQARLNFQQRGKVAEALANLVENDRQFGLAAHRLLLLMSAGQPGAPKEEIFNESSDLAAQQWRIYWSRVEHSETLKTAAPHELHKALKSTDAFIQQAAAHVIPGRRGKMTDGQKLLLARELITMLSSEERLSCDLAQQALISLTGESPQRPKSSQQWSAWWDQLEQEKLIGPRANAYLSMARRLEHRGDVTEAINRYHRIATDFPNTPAADQARQRLDELKQSRPQ